MSRRLTTEECRWIDDTCDAFETARRWGPVAIREQLCAARCSREVEAELLRNLVMIDVDHRLKALAAQGASDVLLLMAYVDEFPELAADARRLVDLVRYEFSSAMEFQLAPRIVRYLQAFPSCQNLERTLRTDAMDVDCRWLQVHSQTIEYQTHLGYDPIEFGRQAKHEVLPIAERYSDNCRRIIVVPSDDSRVSRRHLRIDRTGQDRIMVRNISRKSEVMVRTTRLLSGQCLESHADGEIRIGDTTIRIVPHDG